MKVNFRSTLWPYFCDFFSIFTDIYSFKTHNSTGIWSPRPFLVRHKLSYFAMRNCHSGIIPVRGMSIKFVILLILWRGVILPSPPPTPMTNVDNVTYQKPESPSVTHQNNFSQLLTASHEKSSLCSKSRHSVLLQQTFATRMMKKKARILFPSQLFWNLKRKQAYGIKSYLQNNNRYKETYFFNADLWDKDCMSKLELHPKICW